MTPDKMTPDKAFIMAYEHNILANHRENLEKLAVWWALQCSNPLLHVKVVKTHWMGKARIRYGMGKHHALSYYGFNRNNKPAKTAIFIDMEPLFTEAVKRGLVVQSDRNGYDNGLVNKAIISTLAGRKFLTSNKWHYNLATDTI